MENMDIVVGKCSFFLCVYVCVIQHRNRPLRSTPLNAHGTNASPDGLCASTPTNEAFSCWSCCKSFRIYYLCDSSC